MIHRPLIRALRQPSSNVIRLYSSAAPVLRSRALSPKIPAPTRARILSRWYSTAEESKPAETQKDGDSVAADATADGENALKKEVEAQKKEIVELKDKYLRQVAEYRNLQERTRREMQAAKDFAIQRFARDLVESIDTFDLALSAVPAEKLAPASTNGAEDTNKDLRQLHDGLRMTESVLLNTMHKHGLERFDPSANAEKFDPNRHEAVFQAPQEGKVDGTVFHTTQKGFVLNGRVLRAAKVGVVKNS